jgi:hypothetical protein
MLTNLKAALSVALILAAMAASTERSASQAMRVGDLLFGQLGSVDRLTILEASNGFAIPPMEKAPIIQMRAQIA